jgi:hypothetical protein
MKIESGALHLDAVDQYDARVMRIARRGYFVQRFNGKELRPVAIEVKDKLFEAALLLINHPEQRQLSLRELDGTKLALPVAESAELACFLQDGLLYPNGAVEKRSLFVTLLSAEPAKFIDPLWISGEGSSEAARQALIEVQAFANQAQAAA